MRSVKRAMTAGVVLASVCGHGLAQEEAAPDRVLLSGPSVVRAAPPGMEKTFGMALSNNPMVVRDSISMGAYTKMLRELPTDAALTGEQMAEVKLLEARWREGVGAHYAGHMDELLAVELALPEAEAKRMGYTVRLGQQAIEKGWTLDGSGMELAAPVADAMSMAAPMAGSGMAGSGIAGPGMAGDPMAAVSGAASGSVVHSAADARALLTRIRREAPLPWEAQNGMWNLLSEAQRDAMAAKILEFRLEQRLAREQREMQRAAQKTGGEVGPTLLERMSLLESAARTGALASAVFEALTEADREKLAGLEGEPREAAVRAIAARLIAQESPGSMDAGGRQQASGDGGKPAPSVELMVIPAVDEKKSTDAPEASAAPGG